MEHVQSGLKNTILNFFLTGTNFSTGSSNHVMVLSNSTTPPTPEYFQAIGDGTDLYTTSYRSQYINFYPPVSGIIRNSGNVVFNESQFNWGIIRYVGVGQSGVYVGNSGYFYHTDPYFIGSGTPQDIPSGTVYVMPDQGLKIQMFPNLSYYAQDRILEKMFMGSGHTPPSSVWAGLSNSTGVPESFPEITGGSYSRKQIKFFNAIDGYSHNSGTVSFNTATTNWGDIKSIGLFDGSGIDANYLMYLTMNTETISSGNQFAIPLFSLEVQFA